MIYCRTRRNVRYLRIRVELSLRAKGLTAIYASAMVVWLRDDSPDLGPTMAHLDKSLRRAERLAMALSLAPRRSRAADGEGAEGEAAA